MTQEEIDALLGGGGDAEPKDLTAGTESRELTPEEADILGEVGNMCMGSVAKTMSSVIGRRVDITTPRVSVNSTAEVLAEYQVPFLIVDVEYTEGVRGKNLLLLKERDASSIADIMMGGTGDVGEGNSMGDIEISALSEVMNQMTGASAYALETIIGTRVNISTPVATRVDWDSDISDKLNFSELVVKISFDMTMENSLTSQLLQLMPLEVGRELAKTLYDAMVGGAPPDPPPKPKAAPAPSAPPPSPAPAPAPAPVVAAPPPPPPPPPTYAAPVGAPQYESFDEDFSYMHTPAPPLRGDYGLVSDIVLNVSVELGKTKRDISEILGFGLGTVVMLDKAADDPVEIVVNGKLIARGEVVVVEENYGIRVTEVMSN